MNQGSPKIFSFTLSDVVRWLAPVLIIWFLGSIGLGWLVNSFLILMGLILIAPAIAFLGMRWWVSRNLIEDRCPVCGYESTGLNQTQFQCPSCGEPLKIEQGRFKRLTPPGTIDVEAVEVSTRQIED